MKKYLQYSQVFLVLSAIATLVLGVAVLCCNKIEMHLWLTEHRTPAQDFFWRYYTYVGGWISYAMVVVLLLYKAGWASFLLTDIIASGLVGQGFKYLVNTDRPLTYFADHAPDIQLQLVEGVHMSEWYSFPSGHTITFFVLFMTLAIILQERHYQSSITNHQSPVTTCYLLPVTCYLLPVTCYLLAIAGAYSRIYLNQHFTEDIVGGIIIGVGTTIGLLFLVPKLDQTRFWNWNLRQLIHK